MNRRVKNLTALEINFLWKITSISLCIFNTKKKNKKKKILTGIQRFTLNTNWMKKISRVECVQVINQQCLF